MANNQMFKLVDLIADEQEKKEFVEDLVESLKPKPTLQEIVNEYPEYTQSTEYKYTGPVTYFGVGLKVNKPKNDECVWSKMYND